ncbi:unnamed protein product [[Actinomadura] parvosata subsp. kistnae]|uniref:DUF8094 domain-containing protein n=1 Tax=[Actinomadura] parvosata subsp. kistnae TaxID=1909395 RepID=A0A1V0A8L1_9ACTN|nr:hypothetical protein [Nonomuraea sp. ATCC 55076]AQZ66540.1 hypothetical protein BKM31_38365 [Nonomuraea sp. ATCC 55076]SPL95391.1 unnamed protein product [Actinomadura parvosata subsp. kistnae]
MRAYGRRGLLALAAGLLAAVTACSGDARPAATTPAAAVTATPSPSPDEPEVTLQEAADEFTAFTVTDNSLRGENWTSTFEGRLTQASDITTGGQWPLTQAAYVSTGSKPPRRQWGAPTLYVPRFAQGERAPWFSALATRDGRPTLLTFAKSDRWRLSSAAQLVPGQTLPKIKLDADGYASSVPTDDKTITISPQFMGPVHASVAETGKSGVTAGLLAPGPYTTDVAEQIAGLRLDAKGAELSYDSIFSADNYPVYALRTEGGGALIQYSLTRTSTTKNMANKTFKIPVPPQASWAITDPTVRLSLRLTEVHQYASAVPPLTAPAAAQVVAHDGALTRASGE